MGRKLQVFLFTFVVLLNTNFNLQAQTIQNGQDASAVIGQTLHKSETEVSFTQSGTNNGPTHWNFYDAYAVAVDSVGHRLYVADDANNRILVFNLSSTNAITDYKADYVIGQTDFVGRKNGVSASALNQPAALSYDTVTQYLWVADSGNNRVLAFNTQNLATGMSASHVLGQSAFTTRTAATTRSGLDKPLGVQVAAFNSQNLLFVADYNNRRVLSYDISSPSNGQNAANVIGQSNFTTSAKNGFERPIGLAFDYSTTAPRLFVSDHAIQYVSPNLVYGTVLEFDILSITDGEASTHYLGNRTYTVGGNENDNFKNIDKLVGPVALAYDETSDKLYVSDPGNKRIMIFDAASITNEEDAVNVLGDTGFVGITTPSDTPGKISRIAGLALTPDGKYLFSADNVLNRVLQFDISSITNGENAVGILGQMADYDLQTPDYTTSGINGGESANGLSLISAITNTPVALDSVGHRLFVADYGNDRVLVFNLSQNNTLLDLQADHVLGKSNLYGGSASSNKARTVGPSGLAYDEDNKRLFVSDTYFNRVTVFDVTQITDGEDAVSIIGKIDYNTITPGTGQYNLDSPSGLSYDKTLKRLFVSDNANSRVMIYDVTTIDDSETDPNGEAAINVLGQDTFATKTVNTTANTLRGTFAVEYDDTSKLLFVSDPGNNRVLVYDVNSISNGENAAYVLGQANFTTQASGGVTRNRMSLPGALSYDSANKRLFVADINANRILVFNLQSITNGEDAEYVLGAPDFVTSNSTSIVDKNTSFAPTGLTYDKANWKLWSSEAGGQRVLMYSFGTPPTPTPLPTSTSTSTPSPTNSPTPAATMTATPTATQPSGPTPDPDDPALLTLKQSGKLKKGVGKLTVKVKAKDKVKVPTVEGIKISGTCGAEGQKAKKIKFETDEKGAASIVITGMTAGMECQVNAKIAKTKIYSSEIILK